MLTAARLVKDNPPADIPTEFMTIARPLSSSAGTKPQQQQHGVAETNVIQELALRWRCTENGCRNRGNYCWVKYDIHYPLRPEDFERWADAIKKGETVIDRPVS
jgi:hypothetical protein